jgi:hypothetical protein
MDQSNQPPAIFPVWPTDSNNQDHQDDNDTDAVDDLSYPFDDNNDDEDKENESHHLPNLSYGEVIGKYTDLIKMTQNNLPEMTKLFFLMENMVKRYRSGHTVEIDMCTCPSDSSGTNQVVNAITCPVRNAATMKGKKSAWEVATTKRLRKGMVASQFSQADNDVTLPPPKSKTRSCKFCADAKVMVSLPVARSPNLVHHFKIIMRKFGHCWPNRLSTKWPLLCILWRGTRGWFTKPCRRK